MSEEINNDRRRFFGSAMMTIAACRFGLKRFAKMPITEIVAEKGIMNALTRRTSFDSLKQIDAGVLNVGYAEAGPANGSPVVTRRGDEEAAPR